ncbi:hypothetical protein HF086_009447 [Spodoptera exigua]|uniref:DUF7869 domain-containing protein n=1 Tax=Spodoptera exigua TaxID=7107 RepID=A0A922MGE6_SPOEX|nr:hypothetical protein HF086_009447 [Spodoptera exigua]
MSSRAQIILDLITKDKNNDTIRKKGTVENLNYENNIMVTTTPVIEEPERNEESPMPVDADMDAIDRMMNLLSDSDVGDNNIRQGLESEIILNFDTNSEDALNVSNIEENGTKNGEPYQLPESIEDNNNQLNENNTPIPSPECATNHLDYDCSNDFCPCEQFVYTALEKLDTTSGLIEMDQRGRHDNHRKVITEDVIKSVCDHIKSIQPVESHYTRSRSDKRYLDGDLNFHRLFDLYKEWFDEQVYSSIANTERQYRDIVNEHFKLSFHVPKKDQCDKCHIYKNKFTPTLVETQLHESHLRNKNLARTRKLLDKEAAKSSNGKILTATFDFQKVLNAPHGNLSILYYKRKLSVFNFTIFNLVDKEGTCFMWHEGQGKRGANEVSSCLMKFISKHKDLGANEFRFWSDNCVGQNRNRIVYAMYMYAAATCQVSIRHCFLEVGHTQNEGDSVHALIERSAKNKLIYTPQEWYCLVRWAKQDGKPYIVEEMQYTNFSNFKLLLQGNWIKSDNGDKVQWNKIKEVFVKSENPNKLYYKYDMASNDYNVLSVKKNTRRQCSTDSSVSVEPLYQSNLPIPKAKKDDLINMCNSEIIPSGYHNFFTNLPSVNVSDNDPDSDLD